VRRTNAHQDHDQAGLRSRPSTAGRPGIAAGVIRAAAGALVVGALAAGAPAAAQTSSVVRLPTERGAIAAARAAGLILPPIRTPLDAIPGTIADRETVRIGLDPVGQPLSVNVAQRLELQGVGDYFFQVPGPATDVRALSDSSSQPSLRQGAIVWQGFANGREILSASVRMATGQVLARVPVRIELAMSVGGALVRPGRPVSGPLTLRLTISNVSAIPVRMTTGEGDPAELAPVLDAIRTDLANATAPRPGDGVIPRTVTVLGPPRAVRKDIEVPFLIEGSVAFPARSVRRLTVQGATGSTQGSTVAVRFSALLGGGRPARHTVTIVAEARGLRIPQLDVTATPSLPSPDGVQPPTWQQAVSQDPTAVDGADMLPRVMRVLWQVAGTGVYDAFLGNPDAKGDASTVYRFTTVAPPMARSSGPPPGGFSPLGTVGFSLAGLAVLYALALAWARS
jgi:hypothetical protein